MILLNPHSFGTGARQSYPTEQISFRHIYQAAAARPRAIRRQFVAQCENAAPLHTAI
jgi:hypothetical protein